MNKKSLFLLVHIIVMVSAPPLHADDKAALSRQVRNHKARLASTWSHLAEKDLKHRILPAPAIIIDYLIKDNQLQGYAERPKTPAVDAAFFQDTVNAVMELPGPVKRHMRKHLMAIFLVQELGGTAYGELLDGCGNNTMGFIVLDIVALNRKANAWATWRENSPFAGSGKFKIEATIEDQEGDTRKNAIQYILLHEMGHLVGAATGAHPHWFVGGNPQKWPFTKLSWRTWKRGFEGSSKFDGTFATRKKIRFYSFEKSLLSTSEINATYDQWSKTDFVSLYAATNMYDDFAETYAMYVHVVLQQRTWKIEIKKAAETIREIDDPILEKRCQKKKKYFDDMFR